MKLLHQRAHTGQLIPTKSPSLQTTTRTLSKLRSHTNTERCFHELIHFYLKCLVLLSVLNKWYKFRKRLLICSVPAEHVHSSLLSPFECSCAHPFLTVTPRPRLIFQHLPSLCLCRNADNVMFTTSKSCAFAYSSPFFYFPSFLLT